MSKVILNLKTILLALILICGIYLARLSASFPPKYSEVFMHLVN